MSMTTKSASLVQIGLLTDTRSRNGKRPNALKHGAFAKVAFLAGEDSTEFCTLFGALFDEWMPEGPTEYDAVLSIANYQWRKRRLQHFIYAKMYNREFDPQHPLYESHVLCIMAAAGPEDIDDLLGKLPTRTAEHLRKKCPRANFPSPSEWVAALRTEIISVLLPASERDLTPPFLLIHSADILDEDLFKNELAVMERLDVLIDRAIKRLVQTKTMKQMHGLSGTTKSGKPNSPNRQAPSLSFPSGQGQRRQA